MNSKNEAIILQIIKYTPPLFIITLSVIISLSLYFNSKKTYEEEKTLVEKEYIQTNKELIKNEVNNVYEYILTQQKTTEDKLKQSLKKRVHEAYDIAMNIYNENKHLDNKTVQKMIKDAIRTIRFNNGRGYFFIYSFDYECILLPIASHIEGKNFYNFKDGKGKYLTRDIISLVKKEKEGFMQWWYHKPSDMKNQFKKLGFNKHFEPFDWFIGTGEYIEDFENDIKKDVLDHIHNLKYAKNGYIFVVDYQGNYLNHIRKEIIGLNALEAKDTRTHQTVVDTIQMAKTEGSGYITYIQNRKPGSDLPVKKTSYIQGIQKWEWFIGKGFYEDDINEILEKKKDILDNRLKDNLNNLLVWSIILTIILLVISVYISRILEKSFKKYKDEIKTNLKEITKQHHILAQQSKMAAIGEMIANIAHQWRQPLSMISTAATGLKLKKDFGNLDDTEFNKSLDYINNSTQYLSKTIDDFRNFFENDQEQSQFNIKSAFEDALNIINIQMKDKDIHIIKDLDDLEFFGKKSELVQVLINILNNSKDELLKIENSDKFIFIESKKHNDEIILKIKDNAGGIKEEVLEHVFEPYFTTKHKSSGTGIGLYMVQEIITKHMDGDITMQNCQIKYNDRNYKGAETIIKLKLTY